MIELRGLTWARVNIASYTIKTLALVFLLRYLLLASWLPKETQLPKAAHAKTVWG